MFTKGFEKIAISIKFLDTLAASGIKRRAKALGLNSEHIAQAIKEEMSIGAKKLESKGLYGWHKGYSVADMLKPHPDNFKQVSKPFRNNIRKNFRKLTDTMPKVKK